MMNSLNERALVVIIYMVSGIIFGVGAFWGNGLDPVLGASVGGIGGLGWSWGKELRQVWRAGLWFAAAGLLTIVFSILILSTGGMGPIKELLLLLSYYSLSGWVGGSLFGTGILTRNIITESWHAVLVGVAIGFLIPCLAYCLELLSRNERGDGWSWVVILFALAPMGAVSGGIVGYYLHKSPRLAG